MCFRSVLSFCTVIFLIGKSAGLFAGECAPAGVHLSAEAGGFCFDGRHGVHHPIGRAADEGHF